MAKWVQCRSMFPTRDGAVFCEHGSGHAGHHKGFRKVWTSCACTWDLGNGVHPPLRGCAACSGIGVVLVKKPKNPHIGSTLDSLLDELGERAEVEALAKKKTG